MKKIKIILLSLIIFYSCSPQQRLNRILKNNPTLIGVSTDTVQVKDTILIESLVFDTTKLIEYHDTTVIINTERVLAKYIFDTITKEIYHEITCKGDTVYYYKEVPFQVEKIKYVKENRPYKNYLNIGIVIVFLLIALALMKNIREIFF
jgi:hypothetical protein